jgi:hypothetical protein
MFIPHSNVWPNLTAMGMEQFKNALIQLRKFHGLPPYDNSGNFCRYDGFFFNDLERQTPHEIFERAKTAVAEEVADWNKFRQRYIKRWKLK